MNLSVGGNPSVGVATCTDSSMFYNSGPRSSHVDDVVTNAASAGFA